MPLVPERRFTYGPVCKVPHTVIHGDGHFEEIVCSLAGEYTRTELDDAGLPRDVFTCQQGHIMAMYHELHPQDSRYKETE
jgi:hypothetical protein